MIRNIGIVGLGFVGSAIAQSFCNHGLHVFGYDPYKLMDVDLFQGHFTQVGSLDSLLNTDLMFLCLPTQFDENSETGYNLTSVEQTCEKLSGCYNGIVILKSTVIPGTTRKLSEKYNICIIHNPEFLTARFAYSDVESQRHIILGYTRDHILSKKDTLDSFFKKEYPFAHISHVRSEESEATKLFCNSFYAVKIQMFNEFYSYCKHKDICYDNVTELMIRNGWINPMHTRVPGTDGKLSYGGACFPKDTNALNHSMKQVGTINAVLNACIDERNEMRKEDV